MWTGCTIADALAIFNRYTLFAGAYSASPPLSYSASPPLFSNIEPAREGFEGGPLYFRVSDRANSVSAS